MKMIPSAIAMLFFSRALADELADAYQRNHEDYRRGYNEGWMDRAVGLPTMIPETRSSTRMNGYDNGASDEKMSNEALAAPLLAPGAGGDDAQ
jgi:hypothetical protein